MRHQQTFGINADWPGEDVCRQLAQRASGLFAWASTAAKFINGHAPTRCLEIILKGDVAPSAEVALDALYTAALETVGRWDDEDFVADFRNIMGVILVARQPLSSASIDMLLNKHKLCMHTLSHLSCLLQRNPSVCVLHPSFADFLMTVRRCRLDVWFFDRSTHHRILALRCLDRMQFFFETEHVQLDPYC